MSVTAPVWAFGAFEPPLLHQKCANDPVDDLQHGREQVGMCNSALKMDGERAVLLLSRFPGCPHRRSPRRSSGQAMQKRTPPSLIGAVRAARLRCHPPNLSYGTMRRSEWDVAIESNGVSDRQRIIE